MSRHTPGPWTWSECGDCWLEGGDGSTIMHVDVDGNTCVYRGEPNAHLIAAAPDLLEACQTALVTLNINRRVIQIPQLEEKLRAAIQKAEGVA